MAGSLSKLEAIQAVYAQLPEIACKGYCSDSCGPIPLTEPELEAMSRSANRELYAIEGPSGLRYMVSKSIDCSLLVKGQCSVYESRPLICRLYGLTEGLPCRYGCQPEWTLSDHEAFKLMAEVEAIAARPE